MLDPFHSPLAIVVVASSGAYLTKSGSDRLAKRAEEIPLLQMVQWEDSRTRSSVGFAPLNDE